MEEQENELQVIAFEIIVNSGDARTLVHQSFSLMREGKFDEAEAQLEEANQNLLQAHRSQTGLLHDYATGKEITMDVIMVHAQDHLMTTMLLREVALEMLALYRKLG